MNDEPTKAELLGTIAALKRDKPSGWYQSAKALCGALARLEGVYDGLGFGDEDFYAKQEPSVLAKREDADSERIGQAWSGYY